MIEVEYQNGGRKRLPTAVGFKMTNFVKDVTIYGSPKKFHTRSIMEAM